VPATADNPVCVWEGCIRLAGTVILTWRVYESCDAAGATNKSASEGAIRLENSPVASCSRKRYMAQNHLEK
jgi:hypothetical protein